MRTKLFLVMLAVSGCAASLPRSEAPAAAAPAEPAATQPAAATASVEGPLPAIPNAQQPLPGVVTGGTPSEENLASAQSAGFKTVVSLLPPAEAGDEAAHVAQHGMRFVSIPIAGANDLTEANAQRLGEVLRDPAARPLILHCGGGNRAGALLALEGYYVEHMPAEAALELGVKAGLTKLRPVVAERLGVTTGETP